MCGIVGYIGKRDVATPAAGGPPAPGVPRLRLGRHRRHLPEGGGLKMVKAKGRVRDLEAEGPRRASGHHRHRPHPLGHPRRAHRRATPTRTWTPRARSPSSTTASSTTPPTCAASWRRDGVEFLSETDTEVLAHLIARSQAETLEEKVREALRLIEGTYGIAVLHADFPDRIVRRPQRLPGRPRHRREGDVRRLGHRRAGRPHPPDRHPRRRRDGHPQGRRLPHVHDRGHAHDAPSPPPWSGRPPPTTWAATTLTCTRRSTSRPTPWTACCAAASTTASPPCTSAASNLDAREARGIRRVKILGCGTSYHAGMIGAADDRGAGPHPGRRRAGLASSATATRSSTPTPSTSPSPSPVRRTTCSPPSRS